MARSRWQMTWRVVTAMVVMTAMSGLGVRIDARQGEGLFGAPQDQAMDPGSSRSQLRARGAAINFDQLPEVTSADQPAKVALNLFDDTVTRRRLEALFAGFARELRVDTGALAGEAVAQELAKAGAC